MADLKARRRAAQPAAVPVPAIRPVEGRAARCADARRVHPGIAGGWYPAALLGARRAGRLLPANADSLARLCPRLGFILAGDQDTSNNDPPRHLNRRPAPGIPPLRTRFFATAQAGPRAGPALPLAATRWKASGTTAKPCRPCAHLWFHRACPAPRNWPHWRAAAPPDPARHCPFILLEPAPMTSPTTQSLVNGITAWMQCESPRAAPKAWRAWWPDAALRAGRRPAGPP